MIFTITAFVVAILFALNIGASGAAASMGVAYGSGVISKKNIALVISGIGVFLGAALGGGEVVKTIGTEIVPASIINVHIAISILAAATISLFIANILGIPLSTSEVTVGAVVGVGIAFKALMFDTLIIIMLFWIVTPLVSFTITLLFGKLVKRVESKQGFLQSKKWKTILAVLVVVTGFLEAFSAGMNNVANAIGPLVGAELIPLQSGIILGGLFIGIGAIVLGRRVIETNGKKIVRLSLLQGSVVSGTGATLVFIASIFGLPVPMTQVTTSGIIGIGIAEQGRGLLKKRLIKKLLLVWIVSPVFALAVSYGFIKLFIQVDLYVVSAMMSAAFASYGLLKLMRYTQEDRRSYHEDGGGI
ncbi:anion permease [Cytobacillus sp. IB215665]|uniref:inorganic phosphate transporter n=1 Tax=Cytobacillus sp. IB215665 TaxID=3097357 RepID=UPI002A0CBAD8|nr:anion permease [Cytobacillus sp. IB215665]MDX8365817.1 inorganic phosphate transporter [Cytobacillus sp. IB215665]